MKAWRAWIIILALAGLVAGLAGWFVVRYDRNEEPVYEGRRLGAWLAGINRAHLEDAPGSLRDARRAVRAAGTNAIPTLLRLLNETDSPLKLQVMAMVQRQHLFVVLWRTASMAHEEAAAAIQLLGNHASSMIPSLISAYSTNAPPDEQAAIIHAIASLDSKATNARPLYLAAMAQATARKSQSLGVAGASALNGFSGSLSRVYWQDYSNTMASLLSSDLQKQAFGFHFSYRLRMGRNQAVPSLAQWLSEPHTNTYWPEFALEDLAPDIAARFLTNHGEDQITDGISAPAKSFWSSGPPLKPEAGIRATGEWSAAASLAGYRKVRGRILLGEPEAESRPAYGTDAVLPIFIELQELRNGEGVPVAVCLHDDEGIRFSLADAAGNLVPPMGGPTNTPSGSAPNWVTVPLDGSVRARVDPPTAVTHTGQRGLLVAVPGGEWLIPVPGGDTYLLSATLLPTTNRFHPLGYLAWNVPLRLPPVKISAQRTNP